MAEDISNKTIVVLVVLTVIISILGTVVVLDEVSKIKTGPPQQAATETGSSGQGKVELTLLERPVSTTGHVTLEILPNKG